MVVEGRSRVKRLRPASATRVRTGVWAEEPERAGEPEAGCGGDEKANSNAECSCAEDQKFRAIGDFDMVQIHEGQAEGGEDHACLYTIEDTTVRGCGFLAFEGEGLEEEAAGFGGGEGCEGFGRVDAGEELLLDGGLGSGGYHATDGGEDNPGKEAEGETDGEGLDQGVYGLRVHGSVPRWGESVCVFTR